MLRQAEALFGSAEGLEAGLMALTTHKQTEVWAENWKAFTAFLACATQWRVASVGLGAPLFVGFDYGGCAVVMKGEGHDLDAADWRRFRTLESVAAAALNRRFGR